MYVHYGIVFFYYTIINTVWPVFNVKDALMCEAHAAFLALRLTLK